MTSIHRLFTYSGNRYIAKEDAPQWRRNPSRGAIAGLVVGGLIVAAAEAMSVVAVKEHYGFHGWVALDAIAIAVVLVSCGVFAGRRRKRLGTTTVVSP